MLDFSGWYFEASGNDEEISLSPGYLELKAGGSPAFTHYARLRYDKLPVKLDETFTIEAEIELPEDFYQKQSSYMKLMGTDNFTIAEDKNKPWRINLLLYSDQHPHIVVQHQNVQESTLWRGDNLLPVGKHRYQLVVKASETDPLVELYLDNVKIASTTEPNVPDTLPDGDKQIPKQMVGIDGAAGYDSSSISIKLHSANIYYGTPQRSSCMESILRKFL